MQLGMYTFGDVGDTSPGQRIRDVLERIRLAEEVGLDYVGIGEHHRPDYAISSPNVYMPSSIPMRTHGPYSLFPVFPQVRGSPVESFPALSSHESVR